ncbi:MAG: NUDIX hydrolase [Acidimicrobiales bacterium]|jgi:8-oxo-dGTP pyrophosphatase MutT (NUDIX family)
MSEIPTPRPAATVLALRDGSDGFEVLMLRRNLDSDFVGGAYVFPGGAVDTSDVGAVSDLVIGPGDAEVSRRLGVESGGLAYYVACLRELFEEAGLLIACDAEGRPVELGDGASAQRMAHYRRGVNDGSIGFLEMMQREGLHLDLRGLAYLAHWVTPVGPPRRYDTRFFVALAPRDQTAAHDNAETVEDVWLRPAEALAQHRRGAFEMIFPTIVTLESVAHFMTSREVLEYANALDNITRVEPRIVVRDSHPVIVVPGDEGYDD